MFFVIAAAVLLSLDLVIKYGIENIPDEEFPRDIPGTNGKIELKKLHNPGFPFGFLKYFPEVVRTVPLIITSGTLGVFSYLLPKKGKTAEKAGLALILAGALSNLFDRFFRGYVVDYIHVKKKPADRIIFNLGDFFIASGALFIMAVSVIREIMMLLKKDGRT
jgi:signal peptidase II